MSIKSNDVLRQVVIVLPFLNEEFVLAGTCQSLGFGTGIDKAPTDATLILIDNGSTDGSISIAETIKRRSPKGTVVVEQELERGYVPPRRRGNMIAEKIARSIGVTSQEVLVLQVDADTQYSSDYVASMRLAAEGKLRNVLLEACVAYPRNFEAKFPNYVDLCRKVDREVEQLFAEADSDLIVDDKVAAYRLSDYIDWGEHQREYTSSRDEIHAETSRLYMRAKAKGATRFTVAAATAFPSMRRVLAEPALHFASGGFPRDAKWIEKWRIEYLGPRTIDDFCANPSHPEVQRAMLIRQAHLVGLFAILPVYVQNSLQQHMEPERVRLAALASSLLPKRTSSHLLSNPALFLSDVFELIDSHGPELLQKYCEIVAGK